VNSECNGFSAGADCRIRGGFQMVVVVGLDCFGQVDCLFGLFLQKEVRLLSAPRL